jgi:chromosome segregation ATPase
MNKCEHGSFDADYCVSCLRALLAEARELACAHNEKERAVRDRIDAALADPVLPCARCETLRELADKASHEQGLAQRRMLEAQKERDDARDAIKRAEARASGLEGWLDAAVDERDEARAEVERLKAQIAAEAKDYSQDDVNVMTTDMIAIRKAAVVEAYRRGAEAMREAAARVVEAAYDGVPLQMLADDEIRALPIPKDKP